MIPTRSQQQQYWLISCWAVKGLWAQSCPRYVLWKVPSNSWGSVARVGKCTAILRKAWPHPLWVMKREEISEYLWWRPLAYNSSLSGIPMLGGWFCWPFFLPLSLIHSWTLQVLFGKTLKQCAVDNHVLGPTTEASIYSQQANLIFYGLLGVVLPESLTTSSFS